MTPPTVIGGGSAVARILPVVCRLEGRSKCVHIGDR